MNTYTKAFKPVQAPRSWKTQGANTWLVPLAFKLGVIGALIFFAVNLRISFDEKAESLNREASRIKMKIHRFNMEIANLKIRKEALSSWDVIGNKIKSYNLALRPASSSQVRQLALIPATRDPQFAARRLEARESKVQLTSK